MRKIGWILISIGIFYAFNLIFGLIITYTIPSGKLYGIFWDYALYIAVGYPNFLIASIIQIIIFLVLGGVVLRKTKGK